MCLRYGGHANRVLFVEYGFVNAPIGDGEGEGEVDVQDLVEDVFREGDVGVAKLMKGVLEDEGYWGYIFVSSHVHIVYRANICASFLPLRVGTATGRCTLPRHPHTPHTV